MKNNPLGIFLKPDEQLAKVMQIAEKFNIKTAHLLTPHAQKLGPQLASDLKSQIQGAGFSITTLFCGFDGESYDSIKDVEDTVGLAPADTCESRYQACLRMIDFAAEMGIPALGIHVGFIPDNIKSETFNRLVSTVQNLCDYCAGKELYLHLETGQEKAKTLLTFIQSVDRVNLGVNFDPANMVLYGNGEPTPALRLLGNYVKGVHIKDAKWSAQPGAEWGQEVVPGMGDTKMDIIIRTLMELDYTGPLTIEMETNDDLEQHLQQTIDFLNKTFNEYS